MPTNRKRSRAAFETDLVTPTTVEESVKKGANVVNNLSKVFLDRIEVTLKSILELQKAQTKALIKTIQVSNTSPVMKMTSELKKVAKELERNISGLNSINDNYKQANKKRVPREEVEQKEKRRRTM